MTDNQPRYTTARMRFEIAKAYDQAIADAMDEIKRVGRDISLFERRDASLFEYQDAIKKLLRNLPEAQS